MGVGYEPWASYIPSLLSKFQDEGNMRDHSCIQRLYESQTHGDYVMSDHVWQDNMYAYMEADEFYEPPELANYFKEPLFSILF